MGLIDSYKLKTALMSCTVHVLDGMPYIDYAQVLNTINEQPTVDAEPVRHGKWWRYPLSQVGFPDHIYMMRQCSECEKVFDQKWNYCPNCGARMDERR